MGYIINNLATRNNDRGSACQKHGFGGSIQFVKLTMNKKDGYRQQNVRQRQKKPRVEDM